MSTMFMFSGQGSQVLKMGLDMYKEYDVARETFEEVNDVLNFNLSNIIFGEDSELLMATENAQIALMTVSIAILRTIKSILNKDISELCDIIAGHSVGEYTGLCASGVITLPDTTTLLYNRGKYMSRSCSMNKGGMLAVIGIDIDMANDICNQISDIEIANDNSSGQIVLSGTIDAINSIINNIAPKMNIKKIVRLPVSGAFHSKLMLFAEQELIHHILDTKFSKPAVPIILNITGEITSDIEVIRSSLIKHMTSAVQWRKSILNAQNANIKRMVEIGAGNVLCGLAKRTVDLDKGIDIVKINNIVDILKYVETYY